MPEIPAFTGNSVFLKDNAPVIPAGAIAEKLRSGNFGPYPNQSAPPGFVLPPEIDPKVMAAALRSSILPNIAGNKPPEAKQPGPQGPAAPPVQIDPITGAPMIGPYSGFGPGFGGPPGFGVGGNAGAGLGPGAGLGMGIGYGGVSGGADAGWGPGY